MKMPQETFLKVKGEIETLCKRTATQGHDIRAVYEAGKFHNSAACKDLNKRLRWDLYWAISAEVRDEVAGLNLLDSHIDTALRQAVPEELRNLEKKF